jgi:hypothetical protein
MRRLDLARNDAAPRARRWDAMVLGGALPGMVAAVRFAQRGHRVLVVEEEANARLPSHVREPFFLGTQGPEGVLDACLAELKLGLRDRRRFERARPSYQVLLPGARLDVGGASRSAEELISWGLVKKDDADPLVQELYEASLVEQRALLEAPLVRPGGLRGLSFGRGPSSGPSVPRLLERPTPELELFFEAQLQAIAGTPLSGLSDPARLVLLGAGLGGAARLKDPGLALRRLLRRRLEELHGEVRTVRGFEIVSVDSHPGLLLEGGREAWLARVLVLNAPLPFLAAALRAAQAPVPSFLEGFAPVQRRAWVDLRCDPDAVPEAMASRVIHAEAATGESGRHVVSLALFPATAAHDPVAIAARGESEGDPEELRKRVVEAVRSVMPFTEGRIVQRLHTRPTWDDEETVVEAPEAGSWSWPPEIQPALSTRRPIFALRREQTAALGTPGDLLLGWRGGDAIASQL